MPVPFEKIAEKGESESSCEIRKRVVKARMIQEERFKDSKGIYCNAQMTSRQIHKFDEPDNNGLQLLRTAMTRLDLSARAYDRILKVARTIADLEDCEKIASTHIAEAISYRNLDRESWAK